MLGPTKAGPGGAVIARAPCCTTPPTSPAPSGVHHGHVDLTDQDHRHAVGEEEQGGQTRRRGARATSVRHTGASRRRSPRVLRRPHDPKAVLLARRRPARAETARPPSRARQGRQRRARGSRRPAPGRRPGRATGSGSRSAPPLTPPCRVVNAARNGSGKIGDQQDDTLRTPRAARRVPTRGVQSGLQAQRADHPTSTDRVTPALSVLVPKERGDVEDVVIHLEVGLGSPRTRTPFGLGLPARRLDYLEAPCTRRTRWR